MHLFTPATVRWLALAACAAVLLIEHVRLALRARARGARLALALAVPGAGAVLAWRQGSRAAPIAYGLLTTGYLLLRCWP